VVVAAALELVVVAAALELVVVAAALELVVVAAVLQLVVVAAALGVWLRRLYSGWWLWLLRFGLFSGALLCGVHICCMFTFLCAWLQDGHIDVPDRLFASVADAWKLCTSALSEVKELVPEFFSNPTFLRNINGYSFGQLQDGTPVVCGRGGGGGLRGRAALSRLPCARHLTLCPAVVVGRCVLGALYPLLSAACWVCWRVHVCGSRPCSLLALCRRRVCVCVVCGMGCLLRAPSPLHSTAAFRATWPCRRGPPPPKSSSKSTGRRWSQSAWVFPVVLFVPSRSSPFLWVWRVGR
jgi:hypothetical protein